LHKIGWYLIIFSQFFFSNFHSGIIFKNAENVLAKKDYIRAREKVKIVNHQWELNSGLLAIPPHNKAGDIPMRQRLPLMASFQLSYDLMIFIGWLYGIGTIEQGYNLFAIFNTFFYQIKYIILSVSFSIQFILSKNNLLAHKWDGK
jgi:hypothetical protein